MVVSPLAVSRIAVIILGGSSSGCVLYLRYWTVLISTRGIYVLSVLLPILPGAREGRRGGEVGKGVAAGS